MNRPVDYWHAPVEIPSEQNKHLKIEVFDTEELLRKELQAELKSLRVAHIGTSPDKNDFAGSVNPERLVNRLHFTRASKTEYEVELMRKASVVGARGHNAAKTAFEAGGVSLISTSLTWAHQRRMSRIYPIRILSASTRMRGYCIISTRRETNRPR